MGQQQNHASARTFVLHSSFSNSDKRLETYFRWATTKTTFGEGEHPPGYVMQAFYCNHFCKTHWWKSPTRTSSSRFRRSKHHPTTLCSDDFLITTMIDDTFGARRKLPRTNPMPKQAHTATHYQQNSTTRTKCLLLDSSHGKPFPLESCSM